jgi:D-beta-D-heptose 7-phosphate kinase/D-beta-D-heptose 1-phosphate adenosyltransferase
VIADERKIQMIRVDRECTTQIHHNLLINRLEETPNNYDVIVVSDYAKGVISHKLMAYLHHMKYKIIVDPKPQNQTMYGNVYMITPNEKECKEMGGPMNLIINNKISHVLETQGKKGMILYNFNESWEIESDPVQVYNVSGAGDTVIAIMATCISMGYAPIEAANVANKCAAYIVTQPGTTVVPKDIFMNNLDVYYTEKPKS